VASSAFSARHQSSALRPIDGALSTQSDDDATDDPSRFSMTSPLLGKVDIEQHEAEAINSCDSQSWTHPIQGIQGRTIHKHALGAGRGGGGWCLRVRGRCGSASALTTSCP
jgi:hypothetical protein